MVEASLTVSEATEDEHTQASVTVVIPAYHESAAISEEVRRIRVASSDSADFQLLVIKDGTGEPRRPQDLPRRVQ